MLQLWPLVSLINYKYVPLKLRVLVMQAIAFFWYVDVVKLDVQRCLFTAVASMGIVRHRQQEVFECKHLKCLERCIIDTTDLYIICVLSNQAQVCCEPCCRQTFLILKAKSAVVQTVTLKTK